MNVRLNVRRPDWKYVARRTRLLAAFLACALASACASARPRWVEHVPEGHRFEYVVGAGVAQDANTARRAAIDAALARVAEQGTVRVEVARLDSIDRSEAIGRGVSLERRARSVESIRTDAAPVVASGLRVVDEYHRRVAEGDAVWVLMCRPAPGGGRPAPGAVALAVRSALLPGWGQLAKQQPRRAAVVMTGVALGIPATIVLGAARSDAVLRAERAHTEPVRTYWRDRANALGTARVGAIALAASAYVFGVADAAVHHPGEFYASVAPSRNGATQLALVVALPFGGPTREASATVSASR